MIIPSPYIDDKYEYILNTLTFCK